MDTNRSRRRIGVLGAAAALFGLALPQSVIAAPTIRFDLYQGGCQVAGRGPAGATMTVVWKSRDGDLKDRAVVAANRRGRWQTPCTFNVVVHGDTVKATTGGTSRTFEVPRFTVVPDRTNDHVAGRAPTSGSLSVRAIRFKDFRFAGEATLAPSVNEDGTWTADFDGTIDLRGWDEVEATWTSPETDTLGRWVAVPFLYVRRGASYVEANGRPGKDVTITLRDGSDQVRAIVHDTADLWGWSYGHFLDEHGDGVYVHPGDRIQAPAIADDLDLVVPPVAVTGKPSTDVVTGTCIPGGGYQFRVMRPSGTYLPGPTRGSEWWRGAANGSGTFTVNTRSTTSGGSDLRSRDRIELDCQLSTGDLVARFTTLP